MLKDCLKKILKEKRITAYRIGKDLKIDHGQLSRFFKTGEGISMKNLEAIANRLGSEITVRRKDTMKDKASSRRIAEREIEAIITEFEKRHQVYVRDLTFDAGKVRLTYEEGTVGKPKMGRPPEEPYPKKVKPLTPEDWKRINRM